MTDMKNNPADPQPDRMNGLTAKPDLEMIWITPSIAFKIKKARVDLGLSQQDLAHRLEASQAQIAHYERGDVDMAVDRLFDLSRLLNVSLADLLAD